MIDKKLERKIGLLEEFMDLWNKFFQTLEEGLKDPEWTEVRDDEFLKLKAKVAFRKQYLRAIAGSEIGFDGDATKVLRMCPSFFLLRDESSIRINSIRSLWHECFISMNRLMGGYKATQVKLAHTSATSYFLGNLKKSKRFKKAVVLLVLVMAGIAVATLVPWQNIGWFKK